MISQYENRVKKLLATKPIPYVVGCIYGLYMDYEIDEPEEEYLYKIADPNDYFNEPHDYWCDIDDTKNPLLKEVGNESIEYNRTVCNSNS